MGYRAEILADSMSPDGVRLTTFLVTFARMVLAEFNTHRMFSLNSASSRAIPVKKMIRMVMEDPYIPDTWGKNQKGMQSAEDITDPAMIEWCRDEWLRARDAAVAAAEQLRTNAGVHKQITNRLLEPFMWHTCIVTATEWSNFFHLRNNPMAHPAIQTPARMMQELYESHEPKKLNYGEWHLPLISSEDYNDAWAKAVEKAAQDLGNDHALLELMVRISCARCARVSYLTHDGKRDLKADIELHDNKLLTSGHLSPFEHVARPANVPDIQTAKIRWGTKQVPSNWWYGNFRGWIQCRHSIEGEADILAPQ